VVGDRVWERLACTGSTCPPFTIPLVPWRIPSKLINSPLRDGLSFQL